ncbi:MAG: class I SAM-dependent methyltransferase [Oscillospiraceae bacterium]|nr:class I SAM-dependent methyltransferase [Oscillospiraceae bacterium]
MQVNKNIDHGKAFDWGRTSADYARFRDIYPPEFYQKITDLGLCVKGRKILDLGTGTGVLPRNLHKHGANFTGADISANQIEQARRLTAEAGLDIDYVVSAAEDVDFPAGTFDVVTACQCYVYFDKKLVFPKIHKLLKNGGHFCILFMAWLPSESGIARKTEELILKHNPSWSAHSMARFTYDFPEEASGLFEVADSFHFDVAVSFTRETWHGRAKACRGIGASSLPSQTIAQWEAEHKKYVESLPEIFEIPHFATVLNLRRV